MSEELEGIRLGLQQFDKTITELLDSYLGSKQYDEREVPKWINEINETLMAKLFDAQKPFKIYINTLIMQRKGANVSIVHNNYHDSEFDQSTVITWPKEKTGKSDQSKDTIQCMVSIYTMSALNGNSYTKNEL